MLQFVISFHETDPSVKITEEVMEFPTAGEAIRDARLALGDLARNTLHERSHAGFHTEVRDKAGKVLFRASLNYTSHRYEQGADRGSRRDHEERSNHQ